VPSEESDHLLRNIPRGKCIVSWGSSGPLVITNVTCAHGKLFFLKFYHLFFI
jgi:hypothetical protein